MYLHLNSQIHVHVYEQFSKCDLISYLLGSKQVRRVDTTLIVNLRVRNANVSVILLKTHPPLFTQRYITDLALVTGVAVPARFGLYPFNLAPCARLPIRDVHQFMHCWGLTVPRPSSLPWGFLRQVDQFRGCWVLCGNLVVGGRGKHQLG